MFTVWQEPERWNGYVLGVDTAEGLGHGDYSCIQVVDAKNGEQVAVWHGRIPPDELAHEVYRIGMWYGDALCCVESNNHGLTTITQLRQLGYPKLFRKRSLNKSTDRITQEFGWRTTRTSKPLLIDDLAKAMKNEELILHCEHTIAELRTYRRNEKGGMSGSPFDDRVMSLALANQMRQYAYVPEYAPVVDDSWTFDWWRRQIPKNQEATGQDTIGKNTMRGTV